jgi:SLT domain-containing protein/phage-related protein
MNMTERIEGLSIGLDLDALALDRGLTGLKDKLKTVNSEMKANMSAFDRSDKSIGKYETRLQGLNKKLEVQKRVTVETAKEYDKMVEQYGEGSKEAEKAARAYNNQVASLKNLERYIGKTTKELNDLQEEQRIATSGWTKLGDAAEKTGSKLTGIGDSVKGLGQNMSMAITAPLIGGFAAVTKGTEEFRGDMARLETNALEAGVGIDTVRGAMERLSGVSDETDSNVEALSNLLAMDFSESGMLTAMDALSGAAIKFSDTLKIEGLADGLQETLATGAAIGPFAEMLERSGINLDTFNEGLESAIAKGDEENYILKSLADSGLAKVNEKYRENNEELVKSREASAKFQQSMADLGTTLTPIATKVTDGITGIVDKFNSLDKSTKKTILIFGGIAAALGPVITFIGLFLSSIGGISIALAPVMASIAKAGGLLAWLKGGLLALTGPVGIVIGVAALLVTAFIALYKNSETFRKGVHDLIAKIKELAQDALKALQPAIDAIVQFFKNQLDVIQQFWKENGATIMGALTNIYNFIKNIFENGILPVIQFVMPFILSIIKSVWGNIKGVISGALNIIMGLVKVFAGLFTGDFSKMWEGIKQIFSGAIEFVWNFIQLQFIGRIVKGIGGFVRSIGSSLKSGWTNAIKGIKDFVSTAKSWFDDLLTQGKQKFDDLVAAAKALPGKIGNGIKNMAGKVTAGVKSVANKMAETLGKGVNGVIGGVNWVLGKIGIDSKVPEWSVPQYAKGTGGHPGGLAVVGDGKGTNAGSELIQTPDGKQYLSPSRDTLVNLPKGTQVLSAKMTRQLLDIPKYALGTKAWEFTKGLAGQAWEGTKNVAGKAWDKTKSVAGKAKDVAFDVWDYVSDPEKLFNKSLGLFGVETPSFPGILKDMGKGLFDKAKESLKGLLKNKIENLGLGDTPTSGSGVRRWAGIAKQALMMTGQFTKANLDRLLYQMQTESGGNPKAINLWDINAKRGTPSKGLMQVIDPTFRAYAHPSYNNNVYDPLSNILASIRYALSRYGSLTNAYRGVGYASGGLINDDGLYRLAEGGYPEFVIPTDPSRRTDAMKLLALAGKQIQGNKRPSQLPNVNQTRTDDFQKMIKLMEEFIEKASKVAEINQHITINSSTPLSPSQIARENLKASRQFAMEL